MKVKIVSGIVQEEHYDNRQEKHTLIDKSEILEEKINDAIKDLEDTGVLYIEDIKINTYEVKYHNNGGYNTVGYTVSIFYVD